MATPLSPVIGDQLIGNRVRCESEFRRKGDLRDPDVLRFIFKSPTGSTTTWVYGTNPEVVRDGTGQYHAEILLSKAGTWKYRWEAEGVVTAANESSVRAIPSGVVNG